MNTIEAQIRKRAQQAVAVADSEGYATLCEGSLWLSSRALLEQCAADDRTTYTGMDFSTAPYWLEM